MNYLNVLKLFRNDSYICQPDNKMMRMNSWVNRLYSIFYMGLTALCIVAGIGALAAWLYSMDGVADFNVAGTPRLVRRSKRGFEEAMFEFDINCDLSNIMFMNTRLFYAYILAEWQSKENELHSSILWNMLIKKEDPKYTAEAVPGNFTFRQVGASMRGKPINLTFAIQQVPSVGFFKTKRVVTKQYTLPDQFAA